MCPYSLYFILVFLHSHALLLMCCQLTNFLQRILYALSSLCFLIFGLSLLFMIIQSVFWIGGFYYCNSQISQELENLGYPIWWIIIWCVYTGLSRRFILSFFIIQHLLYITLIMDSVWRTCVQSRKHDGGALEMDFSHP